MAFFSKRSQEEDPRRLELEKIREKIEDIDIPQYVKKIVSKELDKLQNIDDSVAEYSIGVSYLEYVISLPWNSYTDDNLDLKRAERILDYYHYGLRSVKERILDYLAVRSLRLAQPFRVLVVDDEEIARANLEYILKKEGYEVETAENGPQAVEALKSKEFDLLLTDLKMGGMDGIELLETAKNVSPTTETIIFTAYATVSSAVMALQRGAAHYLTKPLDLGELKRVLRRTLEKKRFIKNTDGSVLCFSGPPGTGKTSIGKAVAQALGRKFTRLSLAGMRDEGELRGHRRTYAGAMPGRIISEIKRLGVRNPVFMLDEIDKVGQDFKGNPGSILLEVLDPEQNIAFLDYYLDIPFDLSPVIFIATANEVDELSTALRDRLEIIPFTGYSEKEKFYIAKNYLIPRQVSNNGLSQQPPRFTKEAILKLIRNYTQESGVRNLEREIATICRKLARERLESQDKWTLEITPTQIERLLGPRRYHREVRDTRNRVGVAVGLVRTVFGGEIIFVESSIMPGNQRLILTGSLGRIIKESAQIALSYVRSNAEALGIDPEFYSGRDIHVHIPAGAIPKDGPSAGLTIGASMLSLLTGTPLRSDVAFTGELTLTGRVLPIGGVKEKILAAQRAGIRTVVLPRENLTDVEALNSDAFEDVEIVTVDEFMEIFENRRIWSIPSISQMVEGS